ncbi:hypothetical protein [Anaerococcus sp. Marseille-Q7828]|uniref:hypothetical protein n=1 Tax=Anaerococcus sp. Marseille-Q7828 TaxID=3036300 RepID=UPI0024AD7F8F|nr:hypothetical protein [Anaerococcus sp. Marseille-Q7828]
MKKILTLALITICLSSCTMYPTRRSDEQIFYGDTLIETRETPKAKKINSSFTYSLEEDYRDDECLECQIEDNY